MARPPAYKLYSDGCETMHVSNDLQDLIVRAKRLQGVLGGRYEIRSMNGIVWEGDQNDDEL